LEVLKGVYQNKEERGRDYIRRGPCFIAVLFTDSSESSPPHFLSYLAYPGSLEEGEWANLDDSRKAWVSFNITPYDCRTFLIYFSAFLCS
jgi:hypothetical protein